MKKQISLVLALVLLFQAAMAQQIPDSSRRISDKELGLQYLKKSRNQKLAAWILFGAGMAGWIGGAASYSDDLFEENTSAETIALIGFGCTIASIPLFISAAKNKGRAEILLRYENMLLYHPSLPRSYPAVGISVPINGR